MNPLGAVLATLAAYLIGSLSFAPARVPWLHPGRSARVERDGKLLGHLGHLHPALLARLDLAGICASSVA